MFVVPRQLTSPSKSNGELVLRQCSGAASSLLEGGASYC